MNTFAKILATVGLSGYLPYAPGTWGSLVGAAIWWLLLPLIPAYQVVAIVVVTVVGIWSASNMVTTTGVDDPSFVVIDEVAGVWIALLFAPKTIAYFAAAFILFRIFDILKPWPIKKLEQLPSGYGIMLDDLAAGLISLLILRIALIII